MANDYKSQYTGEQLDNAINRANNPDTTPTSGSSNLITSGGVKAALETLNGDIDDVKGILYVEGEAEGSEDVNLTDLAFTKSGDTGSATSLNGVYTYTKTTTTKGYVGIGPLPEMEDGKEYKISFDAQLVGSLTSTSSTLWIIMRAGIGGDSAYPNLGGFGFTEAETKAYSAKLNNSAKYIVFYTGNLSSNSKVIISNVKFSKPIIVQKTLANVVEQNTKDITELKNGSDSRTWYSYGGLSFDRRFKLSWEKYMNLSHTYTTSYAQGSCCFGKYFIQGYNKGNKIGIFDLENKALLSTIDTGISANTNNHANTLFFGKEKYSSDDYFPLLYLCSGYALDDGNSRLYVLRIQNGSAFSCSLVQTIQLVGFVWTEAMFDAYNNRLLVIGNSKIYHYDMPSVSLGDIEINAADAITSVICKRPYVASNQGHLWHNGMIYLSSGVPTYMASKGEDGLYLCMINPNTGCYETIVSLIDLGLYNGTTNNTYEPEGIFFWNGEMYVPYREFIIKFYLN